MTDDDSENPYPGLSDNAVVILSMLAEGHSPDDILKAYGGLCRADIAAAAGEALRLAQTPPPAIDPPAKAYSVQTIREEHPTAYAPWTPDQEQRLREMVQQGTPIKQIAETLGRQPGGIRSRIKRLGLSEP